MDSVSVCVCVFVECVWINQHNSIKRFFLQQNHLALVVVRMMNRQNIDSRMRKRFDQQKKNCLLEKNIEQQRERERERNQNLILIKHKQTGRRRKIENKTKRQIKWLNSSFDIIFFFFAISIFQKAVAVEKKKFLVTFDIFHSLSMCVCVYVSIFPHNNLSTETKKIRPYLRREREEKKVVIDT